MSHYGPTKAVAGLCVEARKSSKTWSVLRISTFALTLLAVVGCGTMRSAGPTSPAEPSPEVAEDRQHEPSPYTAPGLAMIVIPLGSGPFKIVLHEGYQCPACKPLESNEHAGVFQADGASLRYLTPPTRQPRGENRPLHPMEEAAIAGSLGVRDLGRLPDR